MADFVGEDKDSRPVMLGDTFEISDELRVIENDAISICHQCGGVIDIGAVDLKGLGKPSVGEDALDNLQRSLRRRVQNQIVRIDDAVAGAPII